MATGNDETSKPTQPLKFKIGHDLLRKDADHKTFGISVACNNFPGEEGWHENQIEVYGSASLRDEVMRRLTGGEK